MHLNSSFVFWTICYCSRFYWRLVISFSINSADVPHFTSPIICAAVRSYHLFPFQVVQEYERAVIFRLGRLLSGGAKGPGKIITRRPSAQLTLQTLPKRAFGHRIPQKILSYSNGLVYRGPRAFCQFYVVSLRNKASGIGLILPLKSATKKY